MRLIEENDSKVKDKLKVESVRVFYGGYDNFKFYAVASVKIGNLFFVGVAHTNIAEGDQFSRPKGRQIAIGRALYEAAITNGIANPRSKKIRPGGTVNSAALVIGKNSPEELARGATKFLGVYVPEVLFEPKSEKAAQENATPQT